MARVLSINVQDKTLQTPFPIFWTRYGHITNITRDLMPQTKQETVVLFPATDAYEAGTALPALVTPESHPPIIMLSPRDYDRVANDTTLHLKNANKKSGVHPITVTTRHGKGTTSTEEYIRMAVTAHAGIVEVPSEESLFAEVGKAQNEKLIKKFQTRSHPLQCQTVSVCRGLSPSPLTLCAVQGGRRAETLVIAAQQAATWNADGFVIEAIPYADSKEERKMILESTLKYLPEDKPRLVHRIGHPYEILELVEQGIDLFSSDYITELSSEGFALNFPIRQEEEKNYDSNPDPIKINLFDNIHRVSSVALSVGCGCAACRDHTRAYLHHLCTVHEMLAWILLSIHNMWQYTAFFDEIRNQIQKGTFKEYKEWFMKRALSKMQ